MAALTRRGALRLLALGGAGGLAGCTGGSDRTTTPVAPPGTTSPGTSSARPSGIDPTAAPKATPAPAGSAGASPTAVLPRTTAWQARPGEISPAVKLRVARLLEAAGSWRSGEGPQDARERAAALDLPAGVLDELAPLFAAGESAAVQVVDLQYGGILTGSASVLAVVNQWRTDATGTVRAGGTTFDIRLTRASPQWRVTAVNPARPGRPASTSTAARAVLGNDRIELPFAARADVAAGQVDDVVLRGLTTLSREAVLHISVLRSGHPLLVFGTSRRSDHPRGFAADIWCFDELPVVVPANEARIRELMRAASRTGAYQVGGPVDLDGGARAYFSDNTHQDHVHLGFR